MNIYAKQNLAKVFRYLVLILLACSCLVPFFWIILSSFKSRTEIYTSAFGVPKLFLLENYENCWYRVNILQGLMNSLIYCSVAAVLILVLSSMASYILSKHIKSRLLFLYFILGIMIPIPSVLIPLFVMISKMGLSNTGAGIVVIYTAINMSIAVLILVPFFHGVPDEIEESAVIDGCGVIRRFFMIMLPLVKPALATVAIITFIGNWNDYLLAMVFLAQRRIQTITIKVFTLKDQFDPDFGMVMAGLTVAVIPVIILYIIFQERIVTGMIAGSLKG